MKYFNPTIMDTGPIVKEVIETMEDLSDPQRIEKSKTYFPTSMKVMGVTNPKMKAVIKELKDRYNQWSEHNWIKLCKALVAAEIFECQGMAFEIIGRNKKLLKALQFDDLAELGRNLDNWASVDGYSVGIFGVLWRMGVVRDNDINRLLKSDNHWERRVAVVSTVALNLKSRGGTGDPPRTIRVCEQVVDDHHDMIQKALSWALRELSKSDREVVVEFMEKYDSRLARRVVREVSHKLDFGTKN
ncbi:MAG: DNA alkylation repair protein [Bacteroidales bacterium]|nr:DNA alkylation repair protein [Bacteroidales bacterium]